MNAYDASSTELLEMAAQLLGGSERARLAIQKAYDLGRIDGRVEQCDDIEQKLKASREKVPA